MSVRVVARVRPLLKAEHERDIIVNAASPTENDASSSAIRIPNPKNEAEEFAFQFNSVYDSSATQEQLFHNEVSPTLKHLFQGFDVTLFAYGVTGTGKTHTMRGGKSLAERGVIPRLLSGIYRKGRKIEKDSQGTTKVEVGMSYYEIYNDRVFDLFDAPEKRNLAGLPLRENNGKTVVLGLTERPCTTLKEFEKLYDQANVNRSTSATKLNAHSSRSHAILCVRLTITDTVKGAVRVSTASAIDLAGSEDNRRTENNKDRLVESASINKSLFVLAQCVESISKKQSRIPYRESKMTRILSLGQNNGLTIMILNLAPVRSYHLDTLSSLNFANRTKKIKVKEIENEPMFTGPPCPSRALHSITGSSIQREPLRPLSDKTINATVNNKAAAGATNKGDKPAKAFFVYSDRFKPRSPVKRTSVSASHTNKPTGQRGSDPSRIPPRLTATATVSKSTIEGLVERKVEEILAARSLAATTTTTNVQSPQIAQPPIPTTSAAVDAEVKARLDRLEQRIYHNQNKAEEDDERRTEGLSFLLMAKQHQAHGELQSALRMYRLARPYFPGNEKLGRRIEGLEGKISGGGGGEGVKRKREVGGSRGAAEGDDDDEYRDDGDESRDAEGAGGSDYDDCERAKPRRKQQRKNKVQVFRDSDQPPPTTSLSGSCILSPSRPHDNSLSPTSRSSGSTPRTRQLLAVINSRDARVIQARLKGVGQKRAEGLVLAVGEGGIGSLEELRGLEGVGAKMVGKWREGFGED